VLAALAPNRSAAAPRPAARPATALVAGAAATDLAIPGGAPLAGYGGFPRRAWLPDVLHRFPYAFWFRPSAGVHDPPRARSLLLEHGGTRVLWLAVDVVGVDSTLVTDLARALARDGLQY